MKCTGRNCPMQNGTVDPSNCLADKCPYVTKPLTNADFIRAKTDEELAEYLYSISFDRQSIYYESNSKARWLDWLKQDVDLMQLP